MASHGSPAISDNGKFDKSHTFQKYGLLLWESSGRLRWGLPTQIERSKWRRNCTVPRMLRCPRCDSQHIRASYSKSTLDSVVKWLLNKVPFRCRKCRLRFYRREPQQSTTTSASTIAPWAPFTHRGEDRHPAKRRQTAQGSAPANPR